MFSAQHFFTSPLLFQVELDFHIRQNSTDEVCGDMFSAIEEMEVNLEKERDKFRTSTVDPVDELR